MWDQGSGNWDTLITESSTFTYSYTKTGLNPGTTYQFKYYATNQHGSGIVSDVTAITTSSLTVPTMAGSVTT